MSNSRPDLLSILNNDFYNYRAQATAPSTPSGQVNPADFQKLNEDLRKMQQSMQMR